MDTFNRFYHSVIKNEYLFGTGVWPIIDEGIRMELDAFGEYQPVFSSELLNKIDEEKMNLLKQVCPSSDESPNEDLVSKELFGGLPGIKYDDKIGYYKSLYIGHVSEGEYRQNGSSGGFGTWILKELFENDLIDAVIHVKENKDSDDARLFKYGISESLKEISEGAKTRYYPVELSEVLKKVKGLPGRYAVVGLPSFILSIRLLARIDPVINERILFTIGLICGHQKSTAFADSLAWQSGIEPGTLKSIDFRKKLPDAPASRYGVEMTGMKKNKEVTVVKRMHELTGHDWGQGFFKLNASDFTDDVMNETADVTLGDAWLPEYTKDYRGNNILIVRNTVIGQMLKVALKKEKVKLAEATVDTIIQSQASHFRHTREELGYRLLKKDKKGDWRPQKRVTASDDIPFSRKKIQDLREVMRIQSRLVYKTALERNDLNYFIDKMAVYDKKYKRIYLLASLVELGPAGILRKIRKRILGR